MRRLRFGTRVLDVVGVLSRDAEGVTVRAAWTRTSGWCGAREALGELLTDRGVRAPW